MDEKKKLRERLKTLRRDHVASLPEGTRGLMFHRPPSPVAALAAPDTVIGLYHPHPDEAPTIGYAKWFHEQGHSLALPWFEDMASPMGFRAWHNPFDDNELEPGPFGVLQPRPDSPAVTPDIAFVPLIGFTAGGDRLGQGGGHYDRWLGDNPKVIPIGLAWDCQLVESLPVEAHDRRLRMIVTPTRAYDGGV